jgi:hypothetical protein
MKDITKLGIAAIGAMAIVAAVYVYTGRGSSSMVPPPPPPPTAAAPAPAPPAPAPTHYPVPETEDAKAAPKPGTPEAETYARREVEGALGAQARRVMRPDKLISAIVATVDNLTREKAAVRLWPVQPPGGRFIVDKGADGLTISPDNARRYAPYVNLLTRSDTRALTDAYVRLYPLLQSAYEELGYPQGYFNDRLIAVIDHLLAAPEPDAPVRLVQPHVLYQYADPALESASAGQKIMMRIGADNERQVKKKLRELRRQLAQLGPSASSTPAAPR